MMRGERVRRNFSMNAAKAIFIVPLVLFAVGCGSRDDSVKASAATSSRGLEYREVVVAPVVKRDFERTFRLTGSLHAKEQARLRALVDGPLEVVLVDIGDYVEKGAVLARTRPVDARLALGITEAAFEVAKAEWIGLKAWRRDEEMAIQRARVQETSADFERLKHDELRAAELHKSGDMPSSYVEKARADARMAAAKMEITKQELKVSESGPSLAHSNVVEAKMSQARAAMSQARQRLEDTELRAPFPGTVTFKAKRTGDFAMRGEEVLELTNVLLLEAEFDVPERFSAVVLPGLPVDITITSAEFKTTGSVASVNQTVDARTRTFLIKVRVENPDSTIKAGAFCVGQLSLPAVRNALAIPVKGLQAQEGRSYVWTVKDNVASQRFVRTGESDADFVEVLDGLNVDDVVVVQGAGALVGGDVVKVIGQNGV